MIRRAPVLLHSPHRIAPELVAGKLVAGELLAEGPVVEQVIADLLVLGQPVNRRSGFLPVVCQDHSYLHSTLFGFPVNAGR